MVPKIVLSKVDMQDKDVQDAVQGSLEHQQRMNAYVRKKTESELQESPNWREMEDAIGENWTGKGGGFEACFRNSKMNCSVTWKEWLIHSDELIELLGSLSK